MLCRFTSDDGGTFCVRSIREQDVPAVTALLSKSPYAETSAEKVEATVRRQEYQLHLVEVAGSIVGCLTLLVGPGYREIDLVFVDPAHRGRGYGSAMINLLKRQAVDSCLSVWVSVPRDWTNAQRYFEGRGFQQSPTHLVGCPSLRYSFLGEFEPHPAHWTWRIRSVEPALEGTRRAAAGTAHA